MIKHWQTPQSTDGLPQERFARPAAPILYGGICRAVPEGCWASIQTLPSEESATAASNPHGYGSPRLADNRHFGPLALENGPRSFVQSGTAQCPLPLEPDRSA